MIIISSRNKQSQRVIFGCADMKLQLLSDFFGSSFPQYLFHPLNKVRGVLASI